MVFTFSLSSCNLKIHQQERAAQHTKILQDGGITGGGIFLFFLLVCELLIFSSGRLFAQENASAKIVSLAPKNTPLNCSNELISFDFKEGHNLSETQKAFWMMWFSMRTFHSHDPQTPRELERIGFPNYRSFNNPITGLQAYLTGNKDAVILAFRGSTEFIDWVIDANMILADAAVFGLQGKVHSGFAMQLLSEWFWIKQALNQFATPNTPIYVTGHSLGGALATLAAYILASEGYNIAGLYSFAAPRSGDASFSDHGNNLINGKSLRVVNDRDLVVRYPPRAESLHVISGFLNLSDNNQLEKWLESRIPYAHQGNLLLFDHKGHANKIEDGDVSDDLNIWSTLAHFSRWKGFAPFILETALQQKNLHNEKTYLCLMNNLRKTPDLFE